MGRGPMPEGGLPEALLAPLRAVAAGLAPNPPRQDFLSGVHNPFGQHALVSHAWKFLDLAESAALLDLVEAALGPDIVLWDSELHLAPPALDPEEGRWWPVEPLAGAIARIALETGAVAIADIRRAGPTAPGHDGAQLVLRYMPASSRFNRDPRFPPNRLAAEARPLVNYAKRPLWLVRGEDRGGNDFVTGFMMPAARWTDAAWLLPGSGAGEHHDAKGGGQCR